MKGREVLANHSAPFRPLAWPLLIAGATYLASYAYLASFHGTPFLWQKTIHEGGRLDWLETTLYFPHFLGHVPIILYVALLFTGCWWLQIGPPARGIGRRRSRTLLAGFLILSLFISLGWFGWSETWDFILQKKQSDLVRGEGGAWNLHLPSSVTLLFLIPVYLAGLRRVLGLVTESRSVVPGVSLVLLALLWLSLFTLLVNQQPLQRFAEIWSSPRYIAHSLRELATFPLTYFPLALAYFLGARQRFVSLASAVSSGWGRLEVATALILIPLLAYQVWLPLRVGISTLAQTPAFAGEEGLGVFYLLSSHYFEHFLDSIGFLLACLMFSSWSQGISRQP